MTKHPASFKLPSAVSRYRIAEENCPHWDYDSPGYSHACCKELEDAQFALHKIRHRIKAESIGVTL